MILHLYAIRRKHGIGSSALLADPNVRLMTPLSRPPLTDAERLAVAALERESTISLRSLIQVVARELYREEMSSAGGVLDIGLFGPKLFINDVAAELSAANGILWEMEGSR